MNILFISDNFFGYAREIVTALEQREHRVHWYPDRPSTDAGTKALLRIAPALIRRRTTRFFSEILQRARAADIDQVLVIKGEALSVAMLKRFRAALPRARFTLFFWDSYANMPPESPAKVALFDETYSFDPVDAARDQRLRYRPLFYLDDYRSLPPGGEDIDVLFFGTVHTDRYDVLRRLSAVLPEGIRFEKVLYFSSPWLYRGRRLFHRSFRGARRSEFIFSPLPKAEVVALIARARIVVDIERAVQSGLTMRTLEMLAAGKKLITTNPAVRQADFFDPANICIIDRHTPVVDPAFIAQPYVPPPHALLRRYSLQGWLEDVLPPAMSGTPAIAGV